MEVEHPAPEEDEEAPDVDVRSYRCQGRSEMLVLCLKILHLVLGSDGDIHQVIEVFKLGSGELVL